MDDVGRKNMRGDKGHVSTGKNSVGHNCGGDMVPIVNG